MTRAVELPAHKPRVEECCREFDGNRWIVIQRPVQNRAQVVAIGLQAGQPGALLGRVHGARADSARATNHSACRRRSSSFAPASLEALERVFADRFQHQEALAVNQPDQALLDERLDDIEVGIADSPGRLELEASDEHAKRAKRPLLVLREEVVAPVDRRPHGRLPCRQVAGTSCQQIETAIESLGDLAGRHQLHPRGGQLQRQGQAVEAAADLDHRLVRFEPGLHLARPRHEELGRRRIRERRNRILLLAGKCEPLPARGDYADVRCAGQELGHAWSRGHDLLEVVKEKQKLPGREEFGHITPRVDDLPDFRTPSPGPRPPPRAPTTPHRDSRRSRSRQVRALVASCRRLPAPSA